LPGSRLNEKEKDAMADLSPAPRVKLFAGILCGDPELVERAKKAMEEILGAVDYVSPARPFDFTTYYEAEMGAGLSRVFFSFERIADPADLVEIKLQTNAIEEELSGGSKRSINIDPGYLDYCKVVLASAKQGPQKLYMGRGIYADMTLLFEKGAFRPLPWCFPDFRSGRYDDILMTIRTLFKKGDRLLH
jgi:hypothetical protein